MHLAIHSQPRFPATRTSVPADPEYAALVDRLLLRLARVLEDALLDELLAPGERGLQCRLGGLLVGAPIRHVPLGCEALLLHPVPACVRSCLQALALNLPSTLALNPKQPWHSTRFARPPEHATLAELSVDRLHGHALIFNMLPSADEDLAGAQRSAELVRELETFVLVGAPSIGFLSFVSVQRPPPLVLWMEQVFQALGLEARESVIRHTAFHPLLEAQFPGLAQSGVACNLAVSDRRLVRAKPAICDAAWPSRRPSSLVLVELEALLDPHADSGSEGHLGSSRVAHNRGSAPMKFVFELVFQLVLDFALDFVLDLKLCLLKFRLLLHRVVRIWRGNVECLLNRRIDVLRQQLQSTGWKPCLPRTRS
mmetsp:Transcript_154220/g.494488  ORF Transcript_154220/g.494488 Transcript_154220/m.494488 type:complete len:368 (-) Transcript_154220:579-1682(-)